MAVRLIVGCGYVGSRVAQRWIHQGDTVWAITRTATKATELETAGIRSIVWNWYEIANDATHKQLESCLSQAATILVSVSHAAVEGIPSEDTHTRGLTLMHDLYISRMAAPERGLPLRARWIYLSTTGVFGDAQGEWIDESSPVSPSRAGSIAAASAERWLEQNVPVTDRVVLRPSGIYGPGRVPNWQSIRDGVPLAMDPMSYLNLIHVEDLAAVVEYFSNVQPKHSLYCVSDNQPPYRSDYYRFIAELGNWPLPPFNANHANGARKPRSEGSKRVNASRLLEELPFPFLYPSYREGLSALLGHLRSDRVVPTE